ncbi:MAG TPA: argininosuccinate lyase [Chthoniobacterales bacterium]|jgi:argininosuccinate lyase
MWRGRFKQSTADSLRTFSESISFDWRLFRHDIRGSVAHASALERAGLLTGEELQQIKDGLLAIEADIDAGNFQWDIALEDVHMNIEAELTRRIGAAGAKLHTARSRNDQVATDLRLYLRDEIGHIQEGLHALQLSLLELASKNSDTILPGYTHLQRAQPVYFAHHLLAYIEMFSRDASRLTDTARRMNSLPLGSGAIAGSTIVLDRTYVAELLGFDSVTHNSMDAVSDRDFAVELLNALALIGMHLSRLSEDVILWASAEFGYVTLSDAYTTGSSLMPQKKNPDVAELTRGKTGRLYGNLLSLLTMLKGLPMTYNRDMQEDKEPIFDSIDTVKNALEVFAGMMSEARVNTARMAAAADDWNLIATDLADYLVKRGVPFRHSHEIVGGLVALCNERSCGLADLTISDYQSASTAFSEDIYAILNPQASLAARKGIGAPSPENIQSELARWKELLAG